MLIAPHCDLPDAALRQHAAILGKTGSGKTYTAKGIVERLLDRPQQVAIIDPTGAWWGLRSSRNGKGPGFPVLVVGGDHADIPLPPRSGTAVAHLVAEQRVSVVIDTSRLTIGERTRWFIDFAGELYRAVRQPLTLVIDEVHNFAPQGRVPDPDTGKMLHAANQLFSGGRSRGIRLVGISQRPAKWHKDSLTCVDTMIAMRMLAPQDREAVEAWIEGCGDRKLGRQVLDSLAQLGTGEGWVWYPEGALLQRVKFPDIRTFDSSRTPEDGGPIAAPKSRAEIDLSGIEAAMSAAIEEAKASDPQLLAAEVKDLRRKLTEAQARTAAAGPGHREVEELGRRLNAAHRDLEAEKAEGRSLRSMLEQSIAEHRRLADELARGLATGGPPRPREGPAAVARRAVAGGIAREARASARLDRDPEGQTVCLGPDPAAQSPGPGVSGPHQRILDACAWWASAALDAPTSPQVAFVAGYSPGTGTLNTYFGAMVTAGLIERRAGVVTLTEAGRRAARPPQRRATLADLHARIMRVLDGPEQRLIQAVIDRQGQATPADEIGRAAGYSPGTGTLNTYFGGLVRVGLIARERGKVSATAVLFPEGMR